MFSLFLQMEKKNIPLEPTLKLLFFSIGSNLRFNTPLPITDHHHIHLDNIWASNNNPKNLIPVLHTHSCYFHNKNKSICPNLTTLSDTSQVLKPYTVEHFIEQDRKIKFVKTKVKILKKK